MVITELKKNINGGKKVRKRKTDIIEKKKKNIIHNVTTISSLDLSPDLSLLFYIIRF